MTHTETPASWTLGPLGRRNFIKISVGALALAAQQCRTSSVEAEWPLTVDHFAARAHRLLDPPEPGAETLDCETLIVGGGLAGLAAAHHLRERSFILCELAQSLGGSSGYASALGRHFAQGAHYDLEYPPYYGKDVLTLLEQVGAVRFNPMRNLWTFCDPTYLIPESRESRCLDGDHYREEVLPPGQERKRFYALLLSFSGQMPLPSTLIEQRHRHLDRLSFAQFLQDRGLNLSSDFMRAVDYQMIDDYGAGADQVSAVAGIHYYMCRPYLHADVKLFSHPKGNGYFADLIAARLPESSLRTGKLVTRIQQEGKGFMAHVLDVITQRSFRIMARRVVYAGHKHALPHVMPAAALPQPIRYAPWMVFNFILDRPRLGKVWWQNEALGLRPHFLGFVNSMSHPPHQDQAVFTAYYCFPEDRRKLLRDAEPAFFRQEAQATLKVMEQILNARLAKRVRAVHLKVHGHGMPIPQPGYLFRDANQDRPFLHFVYAGVDNGRLPLMFEALDSGIQAAALLDNQT